MLIRIAKYMIAIVAAVYLLLFIHMRFFWKPDLQPFFDLLTERAKDVQKGAEKQSPKSPPPK